MKGKQTENEGMRARGGEEVKLEKNNPKFLKNELEKKQTGKEEREQKRKSRKIEKKTEKCSITE